MIVVSDSSPLHYLILIGHVDLLPLLFDRVAVPPAVLMELRDAGAPPAVRTWANQPPVWLDERSAAQVRSFVNFGKGESEAISLALELQAELLLADDARARKLANSHGIFVTGTAGVLVSAAKRDLVNLPQAIAKLRTTNFRATPTIWTWMLRQQPKSTP